MYDVKSFQVKITVLDVTEVQLKVLEHIKNSQNRCWYGRQVYGTTINFQTGRNHLMILPRS